MTGSACSDDTSHKQAFIAAIMAMKRANRLDRIADIELSCGRHAAAERLSVLAAELRQQETGGAA